MGARADDAATRSERARAIGLFRYQLIREAADPAHSTRARGRLVRAVAAIEHTDAPPSPRSPPNNHHTSATLTTSPPPRRPGPVRHHADGA